ncbi:putative allantoate permease [Xylariaceae sp. FL1272]|nr:putative allantoate permease [Xylariaceae sp. FL1272]
MGNPDSFSSKPDSLSPIVESLSDTEAAKLVRKIDFKVLPMLFIIYVIAFLDRANISNALTLGLQKELGLTGQQPNTALAIFFVPYIIFEIPSNFLLKKLTPKVWMSVCIFGFGVVELAQGFVQNYSGLLATRFFLGFFEAGIFPGSFYLLSFWYKREEAQKRFTSYFCSVILASAFGGLLASAISLLDGVRGLSNWRWIFILEGILSILVAVAAFFLVADFPSDVTWLSPSEKQYVLNKAGRDGSAVGQNITARDLVIFFKDPKNFCGAIIYFSAVVPVYAFAYFTPTIVKSLGFSTVQTQLHSVPPFAAALGLCIVLAYLADRTDIRLPYVLFAEALVIAGLAILITTHGHFSPQYAGIFLVCLGAFSVAPLGICWYIMNLHGHQERSIGSGWMISFGNIGGIVAPFAFLPSTAPAYRTGYSVCIAVAALGIVTSLVYSYLLVSERRKIKGNEDDNGVKKYSL